MGAGEVITADREKVKAIVDWQPQATVKGVRSFYGFVSPHRCPIENFSEITTPLVALNGKNEILKRGDDKDNAFEKLKSMFVSKLALKQWDPDRKNTAGGRLSGL